MPEKLQNGVDLHLLERYMGGEGTYLEGEGETAVLKEYPHFTDLRHHVGKLNGTNGDGKTPAALHIFSDYISDLKRAIADAMAMKKNPEQLEEVDVGHGYTLEKLHAGLAENNDKAKEVAAYILQHIVATNGRVSRYVQNPTPLPRDSSRLRSALELFSTLCRRASSRFSFRQSEKK